MLVNIIHHKMSEVSLDNSSDYYGMWILIGREGKELQDLEKDDNMEEGCGLCKLAEISLS